MTKKYLMKKIINVKNFIYLTVFFLPLYLVKFSIRGIPVNLLEILTGLTFILWISRINFSSCKKLWQEHKTYIVSLCLIAFGLTVSALINENYESGFGIIKSWFLVPWIFSLIVLSEIKTARDAKNVLKAFFLSAFFVSITSFIYFFSGQTTYDGRLGAFYLSPNHLAMFLAPALFAGLINLKISSAKNMSGFFFWIFCFFSIIFGLYLTQSYAAFGAVLIGFILTKFITDGKSFFSSKVFLFCLLFPIVFIFTHWNSPKIESIKNNYERSSLSSRLIIWKSSIKILADNPLWGIGSGNFQNKYLEYQKYFPPYLEWAVPQPHNLYLAFWLQSGLFGLGGFLFIVGWWLKKTIAIIKKQPDNLPLALLGMVFYILSHGLLDTTIWKNDLALMFWMVIALGISNFNSPTFRKNSNTG